MQVSAGLIFLWANSNSARISAREPQLRVTDRTLPVRNGLPHLRSTSQILGGYAGTHTSPTDIDHHRTAPETG